MLIAEEFVLLALDPEGTLARGGSYQPAAAVGVQGALITELAQGGHLDLADGRLHRTGSGPDHPLLAQVLDNVEPHEGKRLKSRLSSIKHSGWNEVVDGMVADGRLGRDKPALRSTRHPVTDTAGHAALLARVRAAAVSDVPLEPRTATLLALAGPCQMLEVVAPERSDRKVAKRRIGEATEQVPAAEAVKHVIDAMTVAISMAATGAAVAST